MKTNFTEHRAINVYFDGDCPLCSREINFYKKQEGADSINWIDVTESNIDKLPPDLDQESAMSRFHVITEKGNLVSGGEAFSSLWLSLPKFEKAGRLFKYDPFATILELTYRVFLPCRPMLQRLLRLKLGTKDKSNKQKVKN